MNPRVLLLGLWAAVVVVMAAVLARWTPSLGGYGPRLIVSEPVHVVAHTIIYGGLAYGLASVLFTPVDLTDERAWRRLRLRALAAGLAWVTVVSLQEFAQQLFRHRSVGFEELYDGLVDIVGGAFGMVLWTGFHPVHRLRVAQALGVLLHPGFVSTVGLTGLYYSALNRAPSAGLWVLLALASGLPAVAGWLYGRRAGWFATLDVARREERGRLFVLAALSAGLYLGLSVALHAPAVVVLAAALAGLGVLATALVTWAGFKVSGHIAVAVTLGVAVSAPSVRLPVLFGFAAAARSWARARAGVHTLAEVLWAWPLGLALGAAVFYGPW
jgi:hypothetical protein